ncbi:Asp-tRNA(Asn)/Glu-tRNA(Gln) amidotransferase subunit GatC [Aquirhabdus sp.]|uniref:Asp-tRNA(Asn)/Glu-tRNA(Gln) amidotransferase subunit GatC n=1 Tax=Aquirhabdus sp. TaxID=2824160 RepID=UPI00396C83D9
MTDSSSISTTSALSATDINKIAKLAHLQITDDECQRYAASLNNILSLMDHLQTVDTTNIEPLKNPFDTPQPLRDDVATEPNRRDVYQSVAPATQDGLYLVPKVLD